ncbi:MAG: ubiquinone/menaquinone biosynthesis methyltransferase [Chloroflexota bacterium]
MQTIENEHTKYVRNLFGRIAGKYDLLNRLMTFGQDISWRKEAIRHLTLPEHGWVLDIGAGTGDFALEIRENNPQLRIVASDLTIEMVEIGRKRPHGEQVSWIIADALHLPFAKNSFERVVSGFLLRNVADVNQALNEQFRCLLPGGYFASLDTTQPSTNILSPFIKIYLRVVIPTLGRFIAGVPEAYLYLPESTENFLKAEELAKRIRSAGFKSVNFVRRMFGTAAIHWGEKRQDHPLPMAKPAASNTE